MSKFTTEVRWICETFANSQDEYPETITETIKAACPFIFDDSWTTEDADYKPTLEFKILRHYYTQEIGYETVNLWMLKLNTKLAEIMPKYNVLYANLQNVRAKLLSNVDVTESQDLTNNNKTSGTSSSTTDTNTTNDTDTTGKTTTTNTGSSDGTTSGKSDTTSSGDSSGSKTSKQTSSNSGENSGTTSGSSDTWQESNDTPQGGLTGLENRTYLSSAVHNRGTQTGNNSAKTSANGTVDTTESTTGKTSGKDNTTTSGTSHNETSDNGTSNSTGSSNSVTHDASKASGQTSGTSDTTESYVKKIIGKNSGGEYSEVYMSLVNGYKDIDMMIIDDLEPLFMSLWE